MVPILRQASCALPVWATMAPVEAGADARTVAERSLSYSLAAAHTAQSASANGLAASSGGLALCDGHVRPAGTCRRRGGRCPEAGRAPWLGSGSCSQRGWRRDRTGLSCGYPSTLCLSASGTTLQAPGRRPQASWRWPTTPPGPGQSARSPSSAACSPMPRPSVRPLSLGRRSVVSALRPGQDAGVSSDGRGRRGGGGSGPARSHGCWRGAGRPVRSIGPRCARAREREAGLERPGQACRSTGGSEAA